METPETHYADSKGVHIAWQTFGDGPLAIVYVVTALGFEKRQPFRFNLVYWLPESMSVIALKRLLAIRNTLMLSGIEDVTTE